jgi:predicted TIM-barrel fold metal-dependent hydrolase
MAWGRSPVSPDGIVGITSHRLHQISEEDMRVDWLEYPKRHNRKKAGLEHPNDPTLYMDNIGAYVAKLSPTHYAQPSNFKSGSKVNTVKGIIEHPILKVPAYTFEEDDTYVACHSCHVIDPREPMTVIEEHERCGRCGGKLKIEMSGVACTRCNFTFCY